VEKKAPNEMEMAAKEDEERKKAEKAAQGKVNHTYFQSYRKLR